MCVAPKSFCSNVTVVFITTCDGRFHLKLSCLVYRVVYLVCFGVMLLLYGSL